MKDHLKRNPEYEAVWGLRNEPMLANAILESMLGGQLTNVGRIEIYRLIARLYLDTDAYEGRLSYATTAARRGEGGALMFMDALAWYQDQAVEMIPGSSRLEEHIRTLRRFEWAHAACEACESL
jgi:hypothetical protein